MNALYKLSFSKHAIISYTFIHGGIDRLGRGCPNFPFSRIFRQILGQNSIQFNENLIVRESFEF